MTQVFNFQVGGVFCAPGKKPQVSIIIQNREKTLYLPESITPNKDFYASVGKSPPSSETNSNFFIGLKGKCLGSFNNNVFQFEGWKAKEEIA
jgi:hypothetical protein